MTNFSDALQEKIDELEEEKGRLDDKIELLQELIDAESENKETKVSVQRKGGRPPGSKNKKKKKNAESVHAPADELYEEALKQLERSEEGGTSPELQEKLTKKFKPVARTSHTLGAGVVAGTREQVEEAAGKRKPNARVSIDEEK